MRPILVFVWLMLPVGFGAYHYGPGQDRLILDDAAAELAAARTSLEAGRAAQAVKHFDAALALLPQDRQATRREVRVERAKAQLESRQLPAAYDDLTFLIEEMNADPQADPKVLASAKQVMASAQYYLTWLLRLEGEPRDVWEPEIEASRQTYRLLAEHAQQAGDAAAAEGAQQDLEAAIRLARMDLSELQALALPSQCQGCCSGECKCKGKSKGKKKSQNKPESDSFARGASSGPPPDGRGS
jgi:tetratricopeptide (TPR) repeat protein